MSLVINGKKYNHIGLNGKEYSRGYFNGRLVLLKPDKNSYLWATNKVRLAADGTSAVSYLNTPRVISNTLSGQTPGKAPFALSFDVHANAVSQGTTQLLCAQGLMDCIAQNGTLYFKFAWDVSTYALDKQYLKDGWNKVTLSSDGSKIYFQVNAYATVLVDASIIITKSVLIVGFDSSDYLRLKLPFGTYSSYDIIIPVSVQENTNTQPIIARSDADITMYLQGSSKCQRLYPGGQVQASTVMENGRSYWTRLVYDGTTCSAYIAPDDHSMNAKDTPPVSNPFWTLQATKSGDMLAGDKWHIGQNQTTGKFWASMIDIGRTLMYTDGEVFADGMVEPSFWQKFEDAGHLSRLEREYKPPYPQLSVGQISSPVSWTKVRGIKAVIL